MNADVAALIADADRACAAQAFGRALPLLLRAAELAPHDAPVLLKLAGVSRAVGKPKVALDAVHRALAIAPLDFTALVMRASILEGAGDAGAGEAWGHAIAQRPEGGLPAPLAAALSRGEKYHAAWVEAREQQLKAAMATAEEGASNEERGRISRFRTNVLRKTRAFHSEATDFQFPELAEREFHPRRLFPWLDRLEGETETIARELTAVMAAERAELVPYIRYADHVPMRQWRDLNHNTDWTAIHLLQNGKRITANADHCPFTMALLEELPQPIIAGAGPNAMFSLLAPHTAIPPHVGVNNARLICHLPLVVPAGCWFRVGAQTRHWQRAEGFVFDDTIEHEALNPSDELRVVLIFDVWHPDLSGTERKAVAALIGANYS